ncbi:MAG: serine hydrolase [Acidobacteriota bacterium]
MLSLAALATAANAQRKERKGSPPLEAAVDSIAKAAISERSVPGLSVAVMRGARLTLAKGYGFADLDQKIPAAPETVYQLGSISKQFTAAAVMRLVERGKVRLDDPLTKHIPDYPTQGRTVLVRQLLHQTSGIREFLFLPGFDEMESGPAEKYSRDDLINLFKKEPFTFAPGERWAYSNSNYTLLGVIIERASGMSYEQFLQQTFFKPLGLHATHSCGTRSTDRQFAKGHLPRDGRIAAVPSINMNTAIGDGGLCSNVLDLVRWERALAGGRAVSQSSYRRMIVSDPVRRGYRPEYGFALSLVPLDGRRRVGHNGETVGFAGALAHYPDDDLTVAVLINRSLIWAEAIEKAVARAALGMPSPVVKDLPLAGEELQRYTGTYDFGVYPLRVFEEGGRLKFDMKLGRPPYTLLYQGDHTFVAQGDADAIRLTFSLLGGRADKLTLTMAAMRWYADRVT